MINYIYIKFFYFRSPARDLEGRTPKKCPVLSRKILPRAKSEIVRNIFFGVRRGTPRRGFIPRLDYFQNRFEFCTISTALKRNRIPKQTSGRAEGATVPDSPQKNQNPKGFSTLRGTCSFANTILLMVILRSTNQIFYPRYFYYLNAETGNCVQLSPWV